MKSRKVLLVKLMQALVDEWGHQAVGEALTKAAPEHLDSGGVVLNQNLKPSTRRVPKLSATEQIECTPVLREQREALMKLAQRYDDKQFLPSVADVREFLIMLGERPGGMKDRKDAFRVLLTSLRQLPMDHLQQLAQTALHSGPSNLGSLSDAIANASKSLPRRQHVVGE